MAVSIFKGNDDENNEKHNIDKVNGFSTLYTGRINLC